MIETKLTELLCLQYVNGYYFVTMFVIIFTPLLITFIWLASGLTKTVLKRGDDASVNVENSSTVQRGSFVTQHVNKQQRQIRMFKVLLLLMAIYFIFRLPYLLHVIYEINIDYVDSNSFMIGISFGILTMVNCIFNSLLHTFYTSFSSEISTR